MNRAVVATVVIAIAGLGWGCDPSDDPPGARDETISTAPDTIVTTQSGLIAGLADIGLDSLGRLYLLDGRAGRIQVLEAASGRLLRTIGATGRGPGELARPSSLAVLADTILVADPANGRIEAFTAAGAPAGSFVLPPGAGRPAIASDGSTIVPTLGFAEGVATLHARDGALQARLGELPAPPRSTVSMTDALQQIQDGEIPAMLLNAAVAVPDPDGTVWLVLVGAKRVDRYDRTGRLLMTTTLNEPEFSATLDAFVDRAMSAGGRGLPPLSYLRSARLASGRLWVLLNAPPPAPATLVSIRPDGVRAGRAVFDQVVGATDFILAPSDGHAYFYVNDAAALLRVPWPGLRSP